MAGNYIRHICIMAEKNCSSYVPSPVIFFKWVWARDYFIITFLFSPCPSLPLPFLLYPFPPCPPLPLPLPVLLGPSPSFTISATPPLPFLLCPSSPLPVLLCYSSPSLSYSAAPLPILPSPTYSHFLASPFLTHRSAITEDDAHLDVSMYEF